MGKAARNRAVLEIAVAATVGKPATTTKSVARRLRKEEHRRRRAHPVTRRMRYLEHLAATQPAEHRR